MSEMSASAGTDLAFDVELAAERKSQPCLEDVADMDNGSMRWAAAAMREAIAAPYQWLREPFESMC
jgi:hypothetical protein